MAIDLLVVHAPSGAGHKSAALAVVEQARARGLQVVMLELFDDAPRALERAYAGFHRLGRTRLPTLYSRAMSLTNAGTPGYGALRRLVTRGLFLRFTRRVRELAPRAIVSTHHLPLAVLAAAKLAGTIEARIIGLVTDHHAEAVWAQEGVDNFAVPGSEALFGLVKHGIDAAKITTTGLPVEHALYTLPDCVARDHHATHRVLVAGTGFSPDELRAVIRSFARIVNVRVDILCGLDADLRELAQRELDRALVRGEALGHVKSVAPNLEGADLFVGHAGGASVHEAMAAGRTMVSVNAATAEERANERFLLRSDGGRAALAEDVGRVFEELVATDALARLGANGRRATLVHAARSVVEQATTPFWHAVRSAAA